MSLFSSEFELKVPFHDLDPMNVVWHGNYIKYLEQARCDMFDKIGYSYFDMKDDGYIYPIAKMETKFIKPLFFNQEVIIQSTLAEIEPTIRIKYKMFDKSTNEKIFTAQTVQIAIKLAEKTSTYQPPQKLKKLLGVKEDEK